MIYQDEDQLEEEEMKSPFGSSFRTFDATDYSNIGNSENSATERLMHNFLLYNNEFTMIVSTCVVQYDKLLGYRSGGHAFEP